MTRSRWFLLLISGLITVESARSASAQSIGPGFGPFGGAASISEPFGPGGLTDEEYVVEVWGVPPQEAAEFLRQLGEGNEWLQKKFAAADAPKTGACREGWRERTDRWGDWSAGAYSSGGVGAWLQACDRKTGDCQCLTLPELNGAVFGDLKCGQNKIYLAMGYGIMVTYQPGAAALELAGAGLPNDDVTTRIQPLTKFHRTVDGRPLQPTAEDTILLGTSRKGVYRSTDSAVTFAASNAGLPSNLTVWAFAETSEAVLLASAKGIYRSSDGGASWQASTNGVGSVNVTSLAAREAELYAAVTPASSTAAPTVFRSTDGGTSWKATSAPAVDRINNLAVAPDGPWAGTNAGIYHSTDAGATWTAFNDGLYNTQVSAVGEYGASLFAATYANASGLFRSTDRGRSWTAAAAAFANTTINGLAESGNAVLAAGELQLQRSTDGGSTWNKTTTGLPTSISLTYGRLHAVDGAVVLAVLGDGIYRSTDAGSSWKKSSTGSSSATYVSAFAGSASNLFAGGSAAPGGSTGLLRSSDGGATWAPAGALVADTYFAIASLAAEGSTVYAGTSYGLSGVYKSTDSGATWVAVGGGFPGGPIAALAVDGATVYAASATGGLFRSLNGGDNWNSIDSNLDSIPMSALFLGADRLWIGTFGAGLAAFDLDPNPTRLIPIIADVDGGAARYTTELILTNRSGNTASLTLTYTASIGTREGSGSVTDSLAPGEQRTIPNAMDYLRAKGLAIPPASAGQQVGTLLVTFGGVANASQVSALARTTSATAAPQPVGSAGLAYIGLDPARDGEDDSLVVYGLRASGSERSNCAVINVGAEPVTVNVTVVSGAGDGRKATVREAETIPAYGWVQFNSGTLLEGNGIANGWVEIERVSTAGRFSAYGTINDNATNDGSFVLPSSGASPFEYFNIPVIVETSAFATELTLTNRSAVTATFELSYVETLSPSAGSGGKVALTVPAGRQLIIADGIDYLRQHGASIGAAGGNYAGALHVAVSGVLLSQTYAGARIASRSPAGGQFGFFLSGCRPGDEADSEALIYGLRSDANNRTNVGLVHTGGPDSASITLSLQLYDGAAGGAAKGEPIVVTLAPGQWKQTLNPLAAKGATTGWVDIRRTSGSSPWVAYGVINDGGSPGARTGDPAYLPMVQ